MGLPSKTSIRSIDLEHGDDGRNAATAVTQLKRSRGTMATECRDVGMESVGAGNDALGS